MTLASQQRPTQQSNYQQNQHTETASNKQTIHPIQGRRRTEVHAADLWDIVGCSV